MNSWYIKGYNPIKEQIIEYWVESDREPSRILKDYENSYPNYLLLSMINEKKTGYLAAFLENGTIRRYEREIA